MMVAMTMKVNMLQSSVVVVVVVVVVDVFVVVVVVVQQETQRVHNSFYHKELHTDTQIVLMNCFRMKNAKKITSKIEEI